MNNKGFGNSENTGACVELYEEANQQVLPALINDFFGTYDEVKTLATAPEAVKMLTSLRNDFMAAVASAGEHAGVAFMLGGQSRTTVPPPPAALIGYGGSYGPNGDHLQQQLMENQRIHHEKRKQIAMVDVINVITEANPALKNARRAIELMQDLRELLLTKNVNKLPV